MDLSLPDRYTQLQPHDHLTQRELDFMKGAVLHPALVVMPQKPDVNPKGLYRGDKYLYRVEETTSIVFPQKEKEMENIRPFATPDDFATLRRDLQQHGINAYDMAGTLRQRRALYEAHKDDSVFFLWNGGQPPFDPSRIIPLAEACFLKSLAKEPQSPDYQTIESHDGRLLALPLGKKGISVGSERFLGFTGALVVPTRLKVYYDDSNPRNPADDHMADWTAVYISDLSLYNFVSSQKNRSTIPPQARRGVPFIE